MLTSLRVPVLAGLISFTLASCHDHVDVVSPDDEVRLLEPQVVASGSHAGEDGVRQTIDRLRTLNLNDSVAASYVEWRSRVQAEMMESEACGDGDCVEPSDFPHLVGSTWVYQLSPSHPSEIEMLSSSSADRKGEFTHHMSADLWHHHMEEGSRIVHTFPPVTEDSGFWPQSDFESFRQFVCGTPEPTETEWWELRGSTDHDFDPVQGMLVSTWSSDGAQCPGPEV